MLESLFQSIEKLISEFSWLRLLSFFVLFLLIFGSILIFENYTGHFQLSRIEKTAAILQSIQEIHTNQKDQDDAELSVAIAALKKEIRKFTSKQAKITIHSQEWLKALTGASLWLLFTLFFLLRLRNRDKSDRSGPLICAVFCIFLSVMFGSIGLLLPNFDSQWMNYLLYPIAQFFLVVIVFILWWSSKKELDA